MKMKLVIILLFLSVSTINAQLYTPSGAIQGASGTGNIGIGTSNPQQKFVVSNNSAEGFEVYLIRLVV